MFPLKTVVTRNTVLIRFGSTSIPLNAGDAITVYDDDGHYATASIMQGQAETFGVIPTDAYRHP